MSGDEPTGQGGTPADFARQLRETADRLTSAWTGAVGSAPSMPLPALPLPPAKLSARQLQAVLDDLAARRAQVRALQAQLGTFDEQLAALEASLGPLLEWARTWAGLERAMTEPWTRGPSGRPPLGE